MEYSKNPFTPTFGSVPPFLAGREHILRDINRGFIKIGRASCRERV